MREARGETSSPRTTNKFVDRHKVVSRRLPFLNPTLNLRGHSRKDRSKMNTQELMQRLPEQLLQFRVRRLLDLLNQPPHTSPSIAYAELIKDRRMVLAGEVTEPENPSRGQSLLALITLVRRESGTHCTTRTDTCVTMPSTTVL